jgi:hypothetical protein
MTATTITRCEFCSTPLSDPQSIARGVGPECAAKLEAQLSAVGTATRALANGHRDSVLKANLDKLRVATMYAERSAVARKDVARLRGAIAARVERLAAMEMAA